MGIDYSGFAFPKTKKKAEPSHESKLAAWRDAVWLREAGEQRPQQALCFRCKRLVTRGAKDGLHGEVDHRKPRSSNPADRYDPANGRIACHECNRYVKDHPKERNDARPTGHRRGDRLAGRPARGAAAASATQTRAVGTARPADAGVNRG